MWRLLLIPLFALAFFLGAYFFYRGSYDAPPTPRIAFEQNLLPSSSFSEFSEIHSVREGLLVVDGAHRNSFVQAEITSLISRVADRGYAVEFMGGISRGGRFLSVGSGDRLTLLDEKLRQADSLAIIVPSEAYIRQEADIVERFVAKGGKLLLIADPTRPQNLNSLAERFGINFQPDYLYNMVDYDINFQDIFVTEFHPDEITSGLGQIVLYTASSIQTSGTGLGVTDSNTHSSIAEFGESFYPMVKGTDGHVIAISDLTFMIPPQSSILDNGRLISNVADFLTSSERIFDLADFPYFFEDGLDISLGRASLFEIATQVKSLLATFQTDSEIRGI